MRHQATGSISISTDAFAEAVAERLAPLLQPAPVLLTPERVEAVLTTATGSIEALRTNPFSDRQIAAQLERALFAAGYTLAEIPDLTDDQDLTEKQEGFWGRHHPNS